MKLKRLLAVFWMGIFLLSFGSARALAAGNEVKLNSGRWQWSNFYSSVSGYVDVKNLNYQKSVTIHWTDNNGATWNDKAAVYLSTATDNSVNKFGFDMQIAPASQQVKFSIKYVVNGQTYWDNNNGQNYVLNRNTWATQSTATIGSEVVVNTQISDFYPGYAYYNTPHIDPLDYSNSNPGMHHFSGSVILKNIGPTKIVKVRYTTDNWKTYQDGSVYFDNFLPDRSDLEYWKFYIPINAAVTEVKFAVYYTVNGVTYWDSNLGRNYSAVPVTF